MVLPLFGSKRFWGKNCQKQHKKYSIRMSSEGQLCHLGLRSEKSSEYCAHVYMLVGVYYVHNAIYHRGLISGPQTQKGL